MRDVTDRKVRNTPLCNCHRFWFDMLKLAVWSIIYFMGYSSISELTFWLTCAGFLKQASKLIFKGQIKAGICGFLLCIGMQQALLSQSNVQERKLRSELRNASSFNQNTNNLLLTDYSVSESSGVEHFYFRQTFRGLPIIGTESSLHVHKEDGHVALHNRFANSSNFAEFGGRERTPLETLADLAVKLGLDFKLDENTVMGNNLINADILVRRGQMSRDDIPFRRAYLLDESGTINKVWVVVINEPNSSNWWELVIDIGNGNILQQNNYTLECFHDVSFSKANARLESHHNHDHHVSSSAAFSESSEYLVYPLPFESPFDGTPDTISSPWDPISSPFGWHDTNGSMGAEYTITRGNNVHAQEDVNGNNGTGFSPDGTASLTFNFPYDLSQEPIQYQSGAITNLFYWNNIIHDIVYHYGFDEQSGNFQSNNYGNGGTGGDYVFADAQNNGNCNANFATPPEGSNPRMQMFTCNNTSPERDSDLDNGVIIHEYAHGITNRLTGGASNSSCLNNSEQMGEGWSDYYAMVLTMMPGDLGTDSRGMGNYFIGQAQNGGGIRPFPYSTDMANNPQTYDFVKSSSIPHGVGSVWATMLWEMTWGLINRYGFDTDFYHGVGGNNIAIRLVTEALKLQPCSPGFVDGRDAILLADQNLYSGANQCIIWNAFAKRGLGYSAVQGSTSSVQDGIQAFDLPPEIPPVCQDSVDFFLFAAQLEDIDCDTFQFQINAISTNGFVGYVQLDTIDLIPGLATSFEHDSISVPGNTTLTVIDTAHLAAGSYSIYAMGDNGNIQDTLEFKATIPDIPSAISLIQPANDYSQLLSIIDLSWSSNEDAISYDIMLATDSLFTMDVQSILGLVDTNHTVSLSFNDTFYWKVRGISDCGAGPFSDHRNFFIQSCGSTFMDPGGGGNYSGNFTETYIICPDEGSEYVTLTFTDWDIESGVGFCYDYLDVYQGSGTQGEYVGRFCGTTLAESPGSGFIGSNDETGCLTFVFTTDPFVEGRGWEAQITCQPCFPLAINDVLTTDASCFDNSDGRIEVVTNNTQDSLTYLLFDSLGLVASNDSGIFVNLDPGLFQVGAFLSGDTICTDTTFSSEVSISYDAIELNELLLQRPCNGDSNGIITASIVHPYPLIYQLIHQSDTSYSNNGTFHDVDTGMYSLIVAQTDNDMCVLEIDSISVGYNPVSMTSFDGDTVSLELGSLDFQGFMSQCTPDGIKQRVFTNTNRLAINDLESTRDTLRINGVSDSILRIEIDIHITHTYLGDLAATLASPDGTIIDLFDFVGCSQDNLLLTFTDTSSNTYAQLNDTCNTSQTGFGVAGPPYGKSGFFQPEDPLSTIPLTQINGDWILTISDLATFDQGFLESFTIRLFYSTLETQWWSSQYGGQLLSTTEVFNPIGQNLDTLNVDTTSSGVYTYWQQCELDFCSTERVPYILELIDTGCPTYSCNDLSVQLNNFGQYSLNQTDSSNLLPDPIVGCTIDSITLAKTSFDCQDIGQNVVEVIVSKKGGENDTCFATITVEDLYGHCCPDSLQVNQTPITVGDYSSVDITMSRGLVNVGDSVNLFSSGQIVLDTGFNVLQGALFEASIQNCQIDSL